MPFISHRDWQRYIKNLFQFQDNITYERNPWILGILNNFKRSNYRIRVHSNAAF